MHCLLIPVYYICVCACVPCYRILLSRTESARLLGSPGRPLTVRAGCPPNLPFQRDASWPAAAAAASPPQPPSSPGRLAEWRRRVEGDREREGAGEDGSCQLAPSSPARWDVKSVVGLSVSRRRRLYAGGECNSLRTASFYPFSHPRARSHPWASPAPHCFENHLW